MANRTKRLYLGLGGYAIVVVLSLRFGLSFASHALNNLALLAALVSIGALGLLLFRLRPRLLGLLVGSVGALLWALLALGLAGNLLLSGNSAVTVALDGGLTCQETVYGFVTSDSGEELEVYRHFLVLDYRLYHQIHSAVYPNPAETMSPQMAATVAQCQAKINKVRSTPA